MAAKTSLRDYQRDLAARLQSAGSERAATKLGLQVGDGRWLVELRDAGEVIPVPPIAPVPLTRPWFRGVTNIRGNLCSVVDFAAFLGGDMTAAGEQCRLLLFGARYRVGGALLVDRALGLHSVESLKSRSAEGARAPWVRSEYSDERGDRWQELDVPQLVRHPQFLAVGA